MTIPPTPAVLPYVEYWRLSGRGLHGMGYVIAHIAGPDGEALCHIPFNGERHPAATVDRVSLCRRCERMKRND